MPPIKANFVFDQERSSLDVARMIIKHGYTLDMAEHEFFKIFVNNLLPMFKLPSQDTIRDSVLHLYKEEKEKLCRYLKKLSCQFSLIINFRTCHLTRIVYCCLTLQFVDGLELKKKILALTNVGYNCDAETLFGNVTSLLMEWKIHKKVCTITATNEISSYMVIKLNSWLSAQGSLPLSKHISRIECYMEVLENLVWVLLDKIGKVLNEIIKDDIYGYDIKEKFRDAVNQAKVHMQLDSGFLMLEIAVTELTGVFSLLQIDPYLGKVYQLLKVLCDVVGSLSRSKDLTANVYFPKVCEIQKILLQLEESKNACTREMVWRMWAAHDMYHHKCYLALAIAVVFDPRFKFRFVEYSYKELYGEKIAKIRLEKIRTALDDLYDGYENDHSSSTLISPAIIGNGNCSTSYNGYCTMVDFFDRLYNSDRSANGVPLKREELNRYLEEPNLPIKMEIDILGWWRGNTSNFPTLSRMACDILAIPMSVAVSNSVLSPAFDGLDSKITEALICGEDWMDRPQRSILRDLNDMESMRAKPISTSDPGPLLVSEPDCDEEERAKDSVDTLKWIKMLRPIFHPPFKMNDVALLTYTFEDSLDKGEILVDLDGEHITRSGLMSLKPGEWVSSEVINAKVNILVTRQKKLRWWGKTNWYLPTNFTSFILADSADMDRYMRWFRKQENFMYLLWCEKINIPMNFNDNHWFLCVISVMEQKVLILDTYPSRESRAIRENMVKKVLHFCSKMFEHSSFGDLILSNVLKAAETWPIQYPNGVLDQSSTNDSTNCGFYVMKFMELCNVERECQFTMASPLLRCKEVLELLLCEENKKRQDIQERALAFWEMYPMKSNLMAVMKLKQT